MPKVVPLGDDVKVKGVDTVLEPLVLQKQLGQEADVLAVAPLPSPFHLKNT
jgi:hypothetical protein